MPVFIETKPNFLKPVKELDYKEGREEELENLVINNPKIFPIEIISENVQWIPISKQMRLLGGIVRTDTIGVDDEGNIYVIENKLDDNSDESRVSQQVRDYVHILRTMKWEDFLRKIEQANNSDSIKEKKFNFSGKSLKEILNTTKDLKGDSWSLEKSVECFENIKNTFEDGKFFAIICINKISKPLRISIDGENEITDENVMSMFALEVNKRISIDGENEITDENVMSMFALEVNKFQTDKEEKIIVTNTYPYNLSELRERKTSREKIRRGKKFDNQLATTNSLSKSEKDFLKKYVQKLKNKSDDFKYGKGKTSRLLPIFLINGNEKSPIAIDTQGFLSLQFESLCEPEEEKISEDMNVEEKCFSDFIIELKQIEHLDKIIIRSPSGRFTNKNIDLKDWMSFEDKIITILEKVFMKN